MKYSFLRFSSMNRKITKIIHTPYKKDDFRFNKKRKSYIIFLMDKLNQVALTTEYARKVFFHVCYRLTENTINSRT